MLGCHVCGAPATHLWGAESRCAAHPLTPRRIPGTIQRPQYQKLAAAQQPRKRCEYCGGTFVRQRLPSGTMISRPKFARRRYCSHSCSALANAGRH